MPTPTPSDPKRANGKSQVFVRRAISTVVLWGLIALALALKSPALLAGLVVLVGVLACVEFLGLLDLRGTPGWGVVSKVAVLGAAGHLIATAMGAQLLGVEYVTAFSGAALPLAVLGITVALLFHEIDRERTRDQFFGAVFAVVYTAVLSSFLIRILYIDGAGNSVGGGPMSGAYYLLFLLVVTKFSDMGAYLVGTAIGKNKFIPHISPGKTWEGILLGAFPFAIGGGFLIFQLFGEQLPMLSGMAVLVLGAVLTAVAIVGDLAESVLKRCLAKKDSGSALPGIGGVLDLVDSVLFTAPVMYYYLIAFAPSAN